MKEKETTMKNSIGGDIVRKMIETYQKELEREQKEQEKKKQTKKLKKG